ncbi:transport and Golgi organization protein 1-like [Plectropomus leopardus]|uniref:transport and Golgi organization protein 1-like n=1 Tax=Plectropomus leopardus TaxID=160734 RepID=UPI001C4A8A74|nr:transport and Golgi organization protein 1-like [Plectropomus leopardus]
MASALFRRGSGLCARCIHRELCRVVWRPQTALFSSKPSDKKQPRRTHIKKAKPQPAVDIAKLLEQLYSQRRPATTPPAGTARPVKAFSTPTKPPAASSEKVPPLSKTDPAVSVFSAASSSKTVDTDSVATTSGPSPTSTTPAPTETAPIESKTSAETKETNVETASSSLSGASVEPLIETTIESPVEPVLSAVETLEFAEGPVEPKIDAASEDAQTKGTNSGTYDVSHSTKGEPLIETIVESPVEVSHSPVETLDVSAIAEGPIEPAVDAPAEDVQTKDSQVLQTTKEEPLIETTVESPVEANQSPVETLETRAVVVEGPVEPIIDVKVDVAAQKVETKSTDSGVVDIPHTATVESSLDAVEASVEASTCHLETLESRAAEESVETNSTDSGVVSHSAKEELLIETTIEPTVEASTSPISEGAVESAIEAVVNLSHSALMQNLQESAPLPMKNESTVESTVESVSDGVEEGVNKSEEMTLESVTLHVDEVLVASLQTDELLQTKSILDEKAEKQLQESSVQTEIENKAAAESESSSEDESEILTDSLSKWDTLSEDLQELEGESGALVNELLYHVPAALSKTPGTSSASDPPAGANGEQTEETEETEAEAMTLESITLAKVKAEVENLETEVFLEMRDALEKEAEVQAKEETLEDVAIFEDETEAELLARLDSVSEATDALEAETSVLLEAMFGSEQGSRLPPEALLVDQKLERQDEATSSEVKKDSDEQDRSVLETMSLESVTLAEVEASLGNLEDEFLSETTDYLEREAEIVAGETMVEVEDVVVSEETTEAPKIESLSLPEGDALSEDLQLDTLMEDLFFSVPGHATGVTEGPISQEVVTANILDATVADGSVDADTAAAVTDDSPASPALEEVLQGQEEEEEEEVKEEGAQAEAFADLDPVQRLFLEKIKEYNNMRRLNGGLLGAEPDYEKYLSEETAKLQRQYGGGDLSSFPEFTFSEPNMDPDSK